MPEASGLGEDAADSTLHGGYRNRFLRKTCREYKTVLCNSLS
jgi:hypothetical protein